MRRGLIDSLKFPVAEPDYRYDRIKKGEGKKTRDLEEGNGKNQREKKMRAAIDGSASLIPTDVFACVFCLCVCVGMHVQTHSGAGVFDLGTQWQSSGHTARPLSLVCCTGAHCVVAACFP